MNDWEKVMLEVFTAESFAGMVMRYSKHRKHYIESPKVEIIRKNGKKTLWGRGRLVEVEEVEGLSCDVKDDAALAALIVTYIFEI